MDKARLKEVMIEGIDKILGIRVWISGITAEQRAVLLAMRQAVISDDSIAEKVLPNVGPYHEPPTGEEPIVEDGLKVTPASLPKPPKPRRRKKKEDKKDEDP